MKVWRINVGGRFWRLEVGRNKFSRRGGILGRREGKFSVGLGRLLWRCKVVGRGVIGG